MLPVLTPTAVVPESNIHLDRRLCPFLLRVGGGVRDGLHLGERQCMRGEMEGAEVGLGNGWIPMILGAPCRGHCHGEDEWRGRYWAGHPVGNRHGGQWGAEGRYGRQGGVKDEG